MGGGLGNKKADIAGVNMAALYSVDGSKASRSVQHAKKKKVSGARQVRGKTTHIVVQIAEGQEMPHTVKVRLVTPEAVVKPIVRGVEKLSRPLFAVRVIITASLITGIIKLPLPQTDTIVLSYGAFAIVMGLDSRISFILALIGVVDIPLLQHFGYSAYSNDAAVAAFYLLAIGVTSAMIENIRNRDLGTDPEYQQPLRRVTYRLYR